MKLVAGATGVVGSEVCRLLAAKGEAVRAMARATSSPDRIVFLKNSGVQVVKADVKERASLDEACRGIEAVVSTVSSTLSRGSGDSIESVDEQGQLNLIDAAAAAGVSHFVLVSFSPVPAEFPLQTAKRRAEERLQKSGMTWTILRPSMFMEVWLGPALGFDIKGGTIRVYGTGSNPVSWISYRDVARCAVAALERPEARDAIIPLGGPEAISPHDVIALVEKESGRKLNVEHVPAEALRQQYMAAGDSMSRSFAALMLACASGDVVDTSEASRRLHVSGFTSVRDYLRTQLGD